MRQRSTSGASRTAAAATTVSVDVAVFTPHRRDLAVLVVDAGAGDAALPWGWTRRGESIEDAARRVAMAALGSEPRGLAQAATLDGAARHPGGADLSVGHAALAAADAPELPAGSRWAPLAQLPALAPRHRALVERALATIRMRMDHEPIAFHLLPATFTLSELQTVYEILLGRRLHKASFRRALAAAHLVEPLDEWRSEGRGRPAQLHRFAPRRRRGSKRAVRFDMP